MSRSVMPGSSRLRRFPRVSGDEPMPRPAMEVLNGFSPRERG